ncbi:MAG: hypothetical protein ABL995_17270 [Bryobacteraceae bacterium]
MIHRSFSAITLCALAAILTSNLSAQTASTPKRDLAGIWAPLRTMEGIGGNGPLSARADGKHEPPYTAAGTAAFKKNRPSNGTTEVGPGEENDPGHSCDPLGFPRADLFELRAEQIMQNKDQVVILYQYDRLWRSIWTDGRQISADADPRWYGYSTGKWTDDYTFVATTVNMDDRTWLDNAGRPHSDELKVTEIFHRTAPDLLELSVIIDDPKFYSKPWPGIDKIQMKLQPAKTDSIEMMCVPSELNAYNVKHANLGNGITGKK